MDTLENDLAPRLNRIAEEVAVPAAGPDDDLRRGRRRLRRNRTVLAAGGAALAVAATAGVGGLVGSGGGAGPNGDDTPVAAVPDTKQDAGQRVGRPPRAIEDRVAGLASKPGSGEWDELEISMDQMLAASAALEQVAGDRPWFQLALGAERSWADTGAQGCADGWTCEDVAVDGASRARSATGDGVVQVAAEFPGGVVVLTVGDSVDADFSDLAFEGGDQHGFLVEGE